MRRFYRGMGLGFVAGALAAIILALATARETGTGMRANERWLIRMS